MKTKRNVIRDVDVFMDLVREVFKPQSFWQRLFQPKLPETILASELFIQHNFEGDKVMVKVATDKTITFHFDEKTVKDIILDIKHKNGLRKFLEKFCNMKYELHTDGRVVDLVVYLNG